ncbi:MAG: hypothetical protein OEV66_00420 [Spirochaetia bacterium]|nr:hypothetical protein [Spirochaetia bacterium]
MEGIRDELLSGNFFEAGKKSKLWLQSFSYSEKKSPQYKKAAEAFVYSQYFLHRQDRIFRMQTDDQRARYYLELLKELNQIRAENGFEKADNPVWNSVDLYLHARIAENYARAFAGQKSYNLDQDEIIQFSVSLLVLEKWNAAIEALDFLLRLNRHSPVINYLMSYAYDKSGQKIKSHFHLREALFFKPDVISQYPEFLTGDIFEKIWHSSYNEEGADAAGKSRYSEFSLLLEINGVYKSNLDISEKELLNIERNFLDKYSLYEKDKKNSKTDISELLRYLCWLISSYQSLAVYDKVEFYRKKMIDISPETWETFHSKRIQ